jgi:hypothetical protein
VKKLQTRELLTAPHSLHFFLDLLLPTLTNGHHHSINITTTTQDIKS